MARESAKALVSAFGSYLFQFFPKQACNLKYYVYFCIMKLIHTLLALLLTLSVAAQSTKHPGIPDSRVQMRINDVQLADADNISNCHQDGMRSYILRDKTWGDKAVVRIKEVSSLNGDLTLWRLRTVGFSGSIRLEVTNPLSNQRLLQSFEDECFVSFDGTEVAIDLRGDEQFDEADSAMRLLARHILFHTPDLRINTLGSKLAVASYRHAPQQATDNKCIHQLSTADREVLRAKEVLENTFGIQDERQEGRYTLCPTLPVHWDSAFVHTPAIDYRYRRYGDEAVYEVTQRFSRPQKIVIRQASDRSHYRDVEGTSATHQFIRVKLPVPLTTVRVDSCWPEGLGSERWHAYPVVLGKFVPKNINKLFNANVSDVAGADDSAFRSLIAKGEVVVDSIPFRTPSEGENIICTSLSDLYPDSVTVDLAVTASQAWLLMSGTAIPSDHSAAVGDIVATYKDGTKDTLPLTTPDRWHPDARIGQVVRMPLNIEKKLESLTIRAHSKRAVVGLMAVTLQ